MRFEYFFKALPNNTLEFKENACKRTKLLKGMLTIVLCTSLVGEKLPSLVIGKSERPLYFKKISRIDLHTVWK